MASKDTDFQVFAKPFGARCNLSCRYCYYIGKESLYTNEDSILMDNQILENYISSHFEACDGEIITFSWHGGEPTMAGLSFFKKVVGIQGKYKPANSTVINGIQTNATLIDDEWCSFLNKHDFRVGVSIDGPEYLHDIFRRSKDDKGSFSRTLRGYELLKRYGIHTEVLTVINSENVKYPIEVYRFLKDLGTGFITFIPLVEKDINSSTGVEKGSVPTLAFGQFLCSVFDEWVNEDIGKVKIQIIEEALRTAFNQEHTLCVFKKTCGRVPVVEKKGDFYSCDHFVDSQHLIGNLKFLSLKEMLECDTQTAFGAAKFETLPAYCLNCEVIDMCNGECPKNRFIKTSSGESGLNYLCAGYKLFFNHIRPFTDAVRSEWIKNNG